jgi:transcriptional regulator with XRE-family HTH domain
VEQGNLQAFRERQGWSREQLRELLNASLPEDKAYSSKSDVIGRWERGERKMPAHVGTLLDALELEAAFPPAEVEPAARDYEHPAEDSPPPPPTDETKPQPSGVAMLTSGGNPALARVCEELWEMVATGFGVVGAVTGSEALRRDGEIILAEKEALGKAYGKLAETNATFRKMLTGMTTSGAWLEVAMVTGITGGKMMRSHQAIRERKLAEALASEEASYGNGDGLHQVA